MNKEMNGAAERKARSPPERRSSRMSLICLAGKVRLRLRSASLTTICHSTPPRLTSPASPSPLCCAGAGSVSAWQQMETDRMREMGGVDCRQAGACSRGRGDIVRGQPVGLFGSGAPLSASVCLGRRRGSVSCIINEGGRRPVQQRPAAKVSPSCHQPGSWRELMMVMTEVKPGLALLGQAAPYNRP